jgi:putative dehydrogenase
MDVIGSYARKIAVPTPMFDASKAIYAKALRSGHSAEDTAAVCAVLEKMAGVKRGQGRPKLRRRALRDSASRASSPQGRAAREEL